MDGVAQTMRARSSDLMFKSYDVMSILGILCRFYLFIYVSLRYV